MQRLRNDRGAVAVVVAILMVPLLGFAAISIDIAATHAERQQLQTGADAAALAIAQDCARDEFSCSAPQGTAQYFASANSHSDAASAVPQISNQRVRVSNDAKREHWFAPVLGIDSTDVHASATAGWGAVSGGTAMLPLAFNRCVFEHALDASGGLPSDETVTLYYAGESIPSACKNDDEDNQGNQFTPGGFGWLQTDGDTCETKSEIGEESTVDTGASPSNGCEPEDFLELENQIVLLPLFDEYGGQGAGGWYRVSGYAAFKITGIYFTGQYRWGTSCSGSERCVEGEFVEYIDQSGHFDYSPAAPDHGASVVELLPET